ncbi:glycosyltransferase family 2 protein [Anoxybacillus sp. CHMUD]|uniref:glycosyltransferase family 2 protein n=1 Tax=Anoxybacillus sp. CHMUD TaxID=2508870 RepID=UPI0014918C60|nr:glycosyltransferase family A protein [Anoxybacillus sp. CHMUD]NNU90159.1 glycosyltransferase family 2 protein [Anoxybacillus sp. CHMUD]
MKISLIVATKNRDKELEKFFNSLIMQSYKNFEVIVVDQNEDDRVIKICKRYSDLDIILVKSKPGLSRARNVGLQLVSGDIIGFPDDDCIYKTDTLEYVKNFFSNNNKYVFLTGRSVDEQSKTSGANFLTESQEISKKNVWKTAISYTIFVKREVLTKIPLFDERLGVGSGTIFGSGEETDFLLNIIKKSYKGYYDANFTIIHPNKVNIYNKKAYKRALLYGAGHIKVLKKHQYGKVYIIIALLKPLIAMLIYCLRPKKALFYLYSFIGRFKGLVN